MGLKKIVLNIILSFVNIFVSLVPIKKNQIAFVSLEDNVLRDDFLDIYNFFVFFFYSIKKVLIHPILYSLMTITMLSLIIRDKVLRSLKYGMPQELLRSLEMRLKDNILLITMTMLLRIVIIG